MIKSSDEFENSCILPATSKIKSPSHNTCSDWLIALIMQGQLHLFGRITRSANLGPQCGVSMQCMVYLCIDLGTSCMLEKAEGTSMINVDPTTIIIGHLSGTTQLSRHQNSQKH